MILGAIYTDAFADGTRELSIDQLKEKQLRQHFDQML